jgi:Protein of unknown function (DUF2934)
MARLKKGNETTKRRSAKPASAGQQPSAEKPPAVAQQPDGEHAQSKPQVDATAQASRNRPAPVAPTVEAVRTSPAVDATVEATRDDWAVQPVVQAALNKPAGEPTVGPVLSKPLVEPAIEPVPNKPVSEPAVEAAHKNSAPAKPDVEAIRARAYELFLARGGTPGDDVEDWLAAERQLRDEASAD